MQVRDLIDELKRFDPKEKVCVMVKWKDHSESGIITRVEPDNEPARAQRGIGIKIIADK